MEEAAVAYASGQVIDDSAGLAVFTDPLGSGLRKISVYSGLTDEGTDYTLVHQSIYSVHQRVAERLRDGRVLLAGDAAHVVEAAGLDPRVPGDRLVAQPGEEVVERGGVGVPGQLVPRRPQGRLGTAHGVMVWRDDRADRRAARPRRPV